MTWFWLALTYLFYFGQLGVLVPYLGVFLDGRGFSSEQIGELLALITLARILGPNLWSSLADASGKGLRILQFGSFLTFALFCMVFWAQGFWPLTLCFGLMMMFWTAVLPQLEVLTLNTVSNDPSRYSRIRLWGSVGFILFTVSAGKGIDLFGSEAPVYLSTLVLLCLFLATLRLTEPNTDNAKSEEAGNVWHLLKPGPFLWFILSATLLQMSFGPYYGFFALYLKALGYSGQLTGFLIALGVAAEIIIFLLAGRLIAVFGLRWILFISIALTALRWYVIAAHAEVVGLLVLSQIIHAFSFGMTHAASVQFIQASVGPGFQSRGQALYVSIAFGVGGAIGSYLAGQYWQQGTGALLTFGAAAAIAGISALLLLLLPSDRAQSGPGD